MSRRVSVSGTAQQRAVESLRRLIVSGAPRPSHRVDREVVASRVGPSVASTEAHGRILEAVRTRDADRLLDELAAHRRRALDMPSRVLDVSGGAAADRSAAGVA